MEAEGLFALVFVIGMFSGLLIVFMGLRQRSQQLEMQHRERMAMIERGQIPLDPPLRRRTASRGDVTAGSRSISLGIVVIAVGLALMSIVGIAGESPSVGVGIGGAIMIVGGGFVAIGLVRRNQDSPIGVEQSRHDYDRNVDG